LTLGVFGRKLGRKGRPSSVNRSDDRPTTETSLIDVGRLAGAPISWGVCEVPGWGVMLPVDRVLGEMRSLGMSATELGAPGFLPEQPDALREVLARHDMTLVGGFVPLVLHAPTARDATLAAAERAAELFAAVGATVFVTAAVVDEGWGPRFVLDDAQWSHVAAMLGELDGVCADHGLAQALHPHVGTLVETADDVRRVLDLADVRWCLDTGHLAIGGYDPAEFAREAGERVAHVHLKDIDAGVAALVRAGRLTIRDGVRRGLFRPLGDGDAPIADTIRILEAAGYRGWYVLEQDEDLGPVAPTGGEGPLAAATRSVEYLRSLRGPR
jgi:inosose dehydratase